MAAKTRCKAFKIETSASYRIRVQGEINPAWTDIIGDMSLTIDSVCDKNTVTTLVGYLVDQGALSGLLKALYDQHIPILSVENLDEKLTYDINDNRGEMLTGISLP